MYPPMSLNELQKNWDGLGRTDPLWAILAYPERHGRKWAGDEDQFFATGRRAVDDVFTRLDTLELRPSRVERALDFGCGAGRLTLGLARHVALVDGLDIAPSMIRLANTYNTVPDRVRYHLNESGDLRAFADDSFDFILSIIVLQHIPNTLTREYLTEFVRVLRPGGVAAFTLPSHGRLTLEGIGRRVPNSWQNVYRRRKYGYEDVMGFYPLRRKRVEDTIMRAGGQILHVEEEHMAGPHFKSYLYVVGKPE